MKSILSKIFISSLLISLAHISTAQEIDPSLLKNLSPDQIEKVKNQLNNGAISSNPKPEVSESTVKQLVNDPNDSMDQKFGYSFFSSIPTNISAVGDLPLPNDYKISLKDQFTVILSGSRKEIFDLEVNLDGTITFPELGSISVVGESFIDVKGKLKNLIEQSYIGVQIDISIKNLSAKKITIVGAVKTPGTYLVNPFSTISSALAYSGGISEIGTLRKIKLIRNSNEIFYFDLYKLLILGDRSQDITIEAGDVIIIDPASQFVRLTGSVKRNAIYEVIEGEDLSDLISFGLGFTNLANKTNINANILNIATSSVSKITISDLGMNLSNVLSVNVNSYTNKNTSNIEVRGAIKEPGFYDLSTNETLADLIDGLEFIDVYPWLGVLEQFDDNNLVRSTILFSLKDKSTYESITLLPNSKIYFANLDSKSFIVSSQSKEIIDEYTLNINIKGTSYRLPVYGNFSVKSFINLLGIDMSDVDDVATYISPLDSILVNEDYKKMNFVAKKFNTITFRAPKNDLITVTINGAIDYPGSYTLKSNSTLADLYNLVGRFKDEAYLDGIIFTRKSVRDKQLAAIEKSKSDLRESVLNSQQQGKNVDFNIISALSQTIESNNLGRIAGNFSPKNKSISSVTLLDGDSIIIPLNPYVVNVTGEVLNPIAFKYISNLSISDAINLSGGYKDYANKKGVYVIRATGIIEKANRNIFVKNITLNPGDTVVVPRKLIIDSPGLDALIPVTQILSDLAFAAAAIESLSNSN